MDINELLKEAKNAREYSYAPYSNFRIGAALLACKKIFRGCNIENSSYGLTICAERVAMFKAISEGCRDIEAIAIFADKLPYPCGACLQVMSEFCKETCKIILSDGKKVKKYILKDLLPKSFDLKVNK